MAAPECLRQRSQQRVDASKHSKKLCVDLQKLGSPGKRRERAVEGEKQFSNSPHVTFSICHPIFAPLPLVLLLCSFVFSSVCCITEHGFKGITMHVLHTSNESYMCLGSSYATQTMDMTILELVDCFILGIGLTHIVWRRKRYNSLPQPRLLTET